jgi:hypothetical protein
MGGCVEFRFLAGIRYNPLYASKMDEVGAAAAVGVVSVYCPTPTRNRSPG